MNTRTGHIRSEGFTLVELLTTMAVIAVLLALLVPAFNLVQKSALNVKQRGQFNIISTALEAFSTDFGDYPPSARAIDLLDSKYCGAQRLAEAIVGFDGLGFHPDSVFSSDGTDNPAGGGDLVYDASDETNLRERTGIYLEHEAANAVRVGDLYGTGNTGAMPETTFVLADSFGKVKHQRTKKMTGVPILYYKANTSGIDHDVDIINSFPTNWIDDIYNVKHNLMIFMLPAPFGNGPLHPMAPTMIPGLDWFYTATENPNISGDPADPARVVRPYRAESFILQSAGLDGLYGTPDDVFNFDQEK